MDPCTAGAHDPAHPEAMHVVLPMSLSSIRSVDTDAPEPRPQRPVVSCVVYGPDGRRLREPGIDRISDELENPEGFIWMGLYEPDDVLLEKVREEFDLHPLAVEDARNAHQRPKIEVYGDTLFIVMHSAQFVDGEVHFGETHVFLGRQFLITVRHGASASYAKARGVCEQAPAMLALGPSFGLYAVLDQVVDNFFPVVAKVETELTRLEASLFSERFDRATIERLYRLKRQLTRLRLAVTPMHDILNQLHRFFPGLVHEDVRVYFRDVFDHAVRISDAISALGEMVSAALTVNLSMVSVGQNEITRRLAGWAAILAIPTTTGAIYGMNFAHMPELTWEHGYALAMGLTASACVALYLRLKKIGWL